MSQSNPQHTHTAAAQSAQALPTSFATSMLGLRTVAVALLVDRALSA